MAPTEVLCDERTTFRCPVTESRQRCALRIGAEVVAGRLIDESAGGFAVLLDRRPDLHVDQTAILQTDSGWFKVRVKSIVDAPPPEDFEEVEAEAEPEPPIEWIRLGLQRLCEAPPPAEPSVSPFARDVRYKLKQWSPSNRWVFVSGALLAVVAISIPLGVIGTLRYAGRGDGSGRITMGNPWSTVLDRAPDQGQLPAIPFAADDIGVGEVPPAPAAIDRRAPALGDDLLPSFELLGDWGRETQNFVRNSERELRDLMRRLPGPTALALPEVTQLLQLTDEQQMQIRQLIDAMTEAVRTLSLDPELRGTGRDRIKQLRDEVLEDHLRRGLELLTPEQRVEWNKFRGD